MSGPFKHMRADDRRLTGISVDDALGPGDRVEHGNIPRRRRRAGLVARRVEFKVEHQVCDLEQQVQRTELMDFLKEKGVGSGIHYLANHIQPYFKRYGGSLPLTEKIGNEILTLPLYYDMADRDVDLVIKSVTEFIKK